MMGRRAMETNVSFHEISIRMEKQRTTTKVV